MMPIRVPSTSFKFFQVFNGTVQILQRAVVGQIDPLLAAQDCFTIAGETMKQIGRQADEARLSQFDR